MALAGYVEDAFTWEGSTCRVFRRGSGPAVLVIHEVAGHDAGGAGVRRPRGRPGMHRRAAEPARQARRLPVLTEDLDDAPGHPTRAALEQVLQLFRTRLLDAS